MPCTAPPSACTGSSRRWTGCRRCAPRPQSGSIDEDVAVSRCLHPPRRVPRTVEALLDHARHRAAAAARAHGDARPRGRRPAGTRSRHHLHARPLELLPGRSLRSGPAAGGVAGGRVMPSEPQEPRMSEDVIFTPLRFRNLEVKNRVFRSNISGRFDNEDGSLTQTRINWECKFAKGGVGADHLVLRAGADGGPDHRRLRHRPPRRLHPLVGEARRGGAQLRLQVHHAAVPFRAADGHPGRAQPAPAQPVLDQPQGVAARLPVPGDDRGTRSTTRSGPSPAAPGGRARPGSTGSSCTPPTATCSPSS